MRNLIALTRSPRCSPLNYSSSVAGSLLNRSAALALGAFCEYARRVLVICAGVFVLPSKAERLVSWIDAKATFTERSLVGASKGE